MPLLRAAVPLSGVILNELKSAVSSSSERIDLPL